MGESQYIDLARLAETDIDWDGQRNQMSRPTWEKASEEPNQCLLKESLLVGRVCESKAKIGNIILDNIFKNLICPNIIKSTLVIIQL